MAFFSDTVTVLRAPVTRDKYGNRDADWANASRTVLERVMVLPTSQTEDQSVGERDQATTGWRLYTAPGVDPDIAPTDRIEHGGLTLEVVGDVARWPDPLNGGTHHIEVALRRVTG